MMRRDPRCPEQRRRRARTAPPPTPGQFTLRLGRPDPSGPAEVVRRHLLAVLPPGVPPSFTEIAEARFEGRGQRRSAVARLVMVDGASATVEVFAWGHGYAGHRWLAWDGPALFYEGGRWQRDEAV